MSTTIIRTEPLGTDVYLDGVNVGKSPQPMTNDKTVLECTNIKLEKEGYETINTSICRTEEVDVGPVIAGLFVWFPFLWAMKYHPEHFYTLNEKQEKGSVNSDEKTIKTNEPKSLNDTKTKYELIRELKKLLDEGAITQEEFDKEKKKILENN